MNGLLFLLYCIEILGVLLCRAESTPRPTTADFSSSTFEFSTFTVSQTPADPTSVTSSVSETTTQSPTTVSQDSNRQSASPSPGSQRPTTQRPTTQPPTTATPFGMFYRKECLPVFMVTGGLIIVCAILLASTLLLTWKVCQLSRRIKMLSSNADLISTSEYWMGTAKKNKSTSEQEARETTVLMADIGQTQEEMANGTTKEEGGKVSEGGQTGEENKEVGDTAKSEEASTTTVAENASCSKPQEEVTDSTKTVAASKGTEEPKDVV